MAVFVSNVRVAYCRFHYCIRSGVKSAVGWAQGNKGKLTLLLKDEE
ncbi:Uncharacterised protein [Escherichia coli]|nr:Uncharacterised protein [Escherichia coli]